MSQMTEMKREIQATKKLRLSWLQRIMIFAIGAPATFLFALYGRLQLVWPLMISIGMLLIVIWLKWDLRRYARFWVTISAAGIFQIVLVLFLPWPGAWMPAVAMTGISTLDFLLVLWIIVSVERVMGKTLQEP